MKLKLSQQSLPERAELPGPRGQQAVLGKMVIDRYRDRARLAIAAVDRVRAKDHDAAAGQRKSPKSPGWMIRASVNKVACRDLGRLLSPILPTWGPESSSLPRDQGRHRPRIPCPGTARSARLGGPCEPFISGRQLRLETRWQEPMTDFLWIGLGVTAAVLVGALAGWGLMARSPRSPAARQLFMADCVWPSRLGLATWSSGDG